MAQEFRQLASYLLPGIGHMRFTKSSVERLSLPPEKVEAYFWDDALRGFGIKLNRGGARQFLIQVRGPDGRTRRKTIGRVDTISVEQARDRARADIDRVRSGEDIRRERDAAKAPPTLGSVADLYLKHAESKLNASTFDQVHRHLKKNWQPLADSPLDAIKRTDVALHLTKMSETGHRVNATRARSALSALFAWAIGEGIAETNPVTGTNKPSEEKSRDRVLSEAELRAVWAACRNDGYSRIVRILLLTGQRRTEVGSMVESELDLGRAIWTIPGERTKNGVTHEVPLSPLALEILAQQPRKLGRSLVFGEGEGGFSGWTNSKDRLDRRIAATGFTMAPWRLHDLRRTAATMMADRLAVHPHVIEAILNHVSGHKASVAGIYNRATYRTEKRDALNRWAEFVQAVVSDE